MPLHDGEVGKHSLPYMGEQGGEVVLVALVVWGYLLYYGIQCLLNGDITAGAIILALGIGIPLSICIFIWRAHEAERKEEKEKERKQAAMKSAFQEAGVHLITSVHVSHASDQKSSDI